MRATKSGRRQSRISVDSPTPLGKTHRPSALVSSLLVSASATTGRSRAALKSTLEMATLRNAISVLTSTRAVRRNVIAIAAAVIPRGPPRLSSRCPTHLLTALHRPTLCALVLTVRARRRGTAGSGNTAARRVAMAPHVRARFIPCHSCDGHSRLAIAPMLRCFRPGGGVRPPLTTRILSLTAKILRACCLMKELTTCGSDGTHLVYPYR